MFDTWDDTAFAAWLAGFTDGEGCIYIPKNGMIITLANTNSEVIRAIGRRLGYGTIRETIHSQSKWKPKFTIEFKNYAETTAFLEIVRPYLTIKADKADAALAKAARWTDKLSATKQRNIEMLRLRGLGLTHREIGVRFGISRTSVTQALSWIDHHGIDTTMNRKRGVIEYRVVSKYHPKLKTHNRTRSMPATA